MYHDQQTVSSKSMSVTLLPWSGLFEAEMGSFRSFLQGMCLHNIRPPFSQPSTSKGKFLIFQIPGAKSHLTNLCSRPFLVPFNYWSKFGICWLARTRLLPHPRNQIGGVQPHLNFRNRDGPYPWESLQWFPVVLLPDQEEVILGRQLHWCPLHQLPKSRGQQSEDALARLNFFPVSSMLAHWVGWGAGGQSG